MKGQAQREGNNDTSTIAAHPGQEANKRSGGGGMAVLLVDLEKKFRLTWPRAKTKEEECFEFICSI